LDGKVTEQGTNRPVSAPSIQGLSDNKTRKRPVTGSRRCQGEVKVRTGVAAHEPGVRNISIWVAYTNFLLNG
jgi:hypothetical protein